MRIIKISLKQNIMSKEQRRDVFYLDPAKIEIRDGFNVRTDLGDIESLAQSILENGVMQPLKGYRGKSKNPKNYIVTNGHRRLTAVRLLIERGHYSNSVDRPDDSDKEGKIFMPFIFESQGYSDERRIFDMFILNDGKQLLPIEQAEGIDRLLNYGYTIPEVAKKLGREPIYISNLHRLHNAPKKFKNLVGQDVISSTYAIKLMQEHEDFDEIHELIEKARNNGGGSPKAKVTKKDVAKVSGKFNSLSEFKKCVKANTENEPHSHMKETFNLLQDILNGKLSNQDFNRIFYQDPNQTRIPDA